MARWQKLSRNNLSRLEELYSHNTVFSTTVRHSLADYIEERPWEQYNPDNPAHTEQIAIEFQRFIRELHAKIDEIRQSGDVEKIFCNCKALEYEARQLHDKYSKNPANFILNLQRVLQEEMRLYNNEGNDTKPEINTLGVCSMMADLQGSLLVSAFHDIDKHKIQCDKMVRALDMHADEIVIKDVDLKGLQTAYSTNVSQIERSRYSRSLEETNRALHILTVQMKDNIAGLIEKSKHLLQAIQIAQEHVIDEIDEWRDRQRLCMINGAPTPPLEAIERNTAHLADYLMSCAAYFPRVRKHLTHDMTEVGAALSAWHHEIVQQIQQLMKKSFIIEEQPPQVMKKDTRFSATVRIIAGEKWGFNINLPTVKVLLVNMEQVRTILCVLNSTTEHMPEIPNYGDIVNGEKVMEYSNQTKVLHLHYKNLVLRRLKRTDRRASELVTEEKFGVYFQCKVALQFKDLYNDTSPTLTLAALSLPVVVIVHGNQSPAAEATIFWDNCCAERNRDSFIHPQEHTWCELKERLNDWFKKNTQRTLTEEVLVFLGMKVLNTDTDSALDSKKVRWQNFAKDPLKNPERSFTFWEWLYSCSELIKKYCLPIWKAGLIHGFIAKSRTEAMLQQTEPYTFILRFSDSCTGMLSGAFKLPDMTFKHVIWGSKQLQQKPLAERILDPPEFKYLYPNYPKEAKFRAFENHLEQHIEGYARDILKTTIPRTFPLSGPNTPIHQNMIAESQFSEELFMEPMEECEHGLQLNNMDYHHHHQSLISSTQLTQHHLNTHQLGGGNHHGMSFQELP